MVRSLNRVSGQLRLKSSRVLIVGAGGLGCPAAAYLAGAGVGTIGVIDGDVVEPSNLHRQIAHATSRVGWPKTESLIAYLREVNPLPVYNSYPEHLTTENAEEIVSKYDLVLDCTDHPTSRYLISDICVLLQKPLVSASALRTDGQMIVLNCPASPQGTVDSPGKPCYRCVFPKPPPPESVVSCGEGGVLGPVVGTMGVLQAGEALKIIAAGQHMPEESRPAAEPQPPSLLLYSSPPNSPPSFRSVRMRGRRKDCLACSSASTMTLESFRSGSLDYVQFCGGAPEAPLSVLAPEERISAAEYHGLMSSSRVNEGHLLLDVREREHFAISAIDGAVNIPYSIIQQSSKDKSGQGDVGETQTGPDWIPPTLPHHAPIYVVCRVGDNSQLVARRLKEMGLDRSGERWIGDIRGGMRAWKEEVDETLPFT